MELILELVRPVGNAVAKYVFKNKAFEKNSVMSDALGFLIIILTLIFIGWLIFRG